METAHSDSAHEKSKFHTFVQLAMYLAIITGLEIVIIFLPFSYSVLFTVLAVLSVIKFLAVIFWFMHLIYDKLIVQSRQLGFSLDDVTQQLQKRDGQLSGNEKQS